MPKFVGNIEAYLPGTDFGSYEDRLEQWFKVNAVAENNKTPLLITVIGTDVYEVLRSLTMPKKPSELTYEQLMKHLRGHFEVNCNKRAERFKYFSAQQEEGESINDYIVKLKTLAQSCGFGDYLEKALDAEQAQEAGVDAVLAVMKLKCLEEALTDRFILGLRDGRLQRKLMDEDDYDFEKCCRIAVNFELSNREVAAIQPWAHHSVHGGHRKSASAFTKKKQWTSGREKGTEGQKKFNRCKRCGRFHDESKCPAVNWQCFKCSEVGHTSKVCRNRAKGNTNQVQNEEEASVDSINCVQQVNQAMCTTVQVEGQPLVMEVDTGACATIVGKDEYNQKLAKNCKLMNCNLNLSTVTGQYIQVMGKSRVSVRCNGVEAVLDLIIVDTHQNRALLGRSWLDVLFPDWRERWEPPRIDLVKTASVLTEVRRKFPKIVHSPEDQSVVGFEAEILVKPDAPPIFHCAYTVPYKLRDRVEQELSRLVSVGILEPVKYSRWASPIVIVPKASGELRICMDCKVTINPYVIMQHYPLPRMEDICANMANSSWFCVIDLKGAYQQIVVSEKSREYLTINTFKGLFRFTRLPFGVNVAPKIFQSIMEQILGGLSQVFCFIDDIIVCGQSEEECKSKLFEVLSRLDQHNVSLKLEKCKFLERTVEYLGHVLSNGQVRPNEEKVRAIVDAPAPQNVQQLMAYLGLLNYYGKFIPNLSSQIKDLYKLLRKDEEFIWSESCEKAFQDSKKLIVSNNILELYDPNKPIIVATDASPYGVGAVLAQVVNGIEKPVLFVSSSLSPAQKNYSQLHREALAIIFAIDKFHNYLYGQKFTLATDHEALKEIFNPRKGTSGVAAARLQRWSVLLSMYEYDIVHRKGSKMGHADALSRLPLSQETDVETFEINFFNHSQEMPLQQELIRSEMKEDRVLKKIYNYVMNGWSGTIEEKCKPYYSIRNELASENHCLFYRNRIVIPNKLKNRALEAIHEGHTGIVRMKMLARSYFWWQKIEDDITSFVSNCQVCQQTQNRKPNKNLNPWPNTTYPMERVHIDFFHFNGENYLLIIDAFSKYIDIEIMRNSNARALIERLRVLFAVFGLPTEIVSDNGPPFGSFEFKKFCEKHGIKVTKSPPYHPQSNGLAERGVQTVKKEFARFCLDKQLLNLSIRERIQKFLFKSRNVPSTVTKKTPTEMIFSFKPRTLLDLINRKEKSSETKETIEKMAKITKQKKEIVKEPLVELFEKEKVYYLNHFKSYVKWIPALIMKKLSKVTYLISVNERIRMAHRDQLRKKERSDEINAKCKILPKVVTQNRKQVIENPRQNIKRKRQVEINERNILVEAKRVRKQPDRLNINWKQN